MINDYMRVHCFMFFFFHDTAATEIYTYGHTLSLHDALPILLGARVLGNAHELAALEAIVHPAVGKAQKRFLARHRARDLVVLDIPLLFEKGGWRKVGAIAVVSAPAWMQRRRVMSRPGLTAAKQIGSAHV